jgi:hypothetical protein
MHVLLSGVVGSTAYGLAGPDSDVDRLGVFAAPTIAFHGLHGPKESEVTTAPDVTLHEAGKFAGLALKSNPTVSELMWLEDYETQTALGEGLIAIRHEFLSAPAVGNAYLGYAYQQLQKLINRGNGSFSADIPERRAEKHARHLARLVEQGELLYTTGHLVVSLTDPDRIRAIGRTIVDDPYAGASLIEDAKRRIEEIGSPLPDQPNTAAVERWLLRVRAHHYQEPQL